MFCWALLSALAITGAMAACPIAPAPHGPNVICHERGYLTNATYDSQFYAPTYDSCYSRCSSSVFCVVVEYNTKLKRCRLSEFRIIDQGFRKDARSPNILSNGYCSRNKAPCGLQNPSFEDPDVTGGNVVPRPRAIGTNLRQIYLMPWYPISDPGTSFAYRVSNNNLPGNVQPTPDGNHFVNITIPDNAYMFFSQSINLVAGTTYDVSFLYNFISFAGDRNNANTLYQILLTFDNNERSWNITSLNVKPKRGDDDGKWKTVSGSFVVPTIRNNDFLYVTVRLFPHVNSTDPTTAVFGLDNFKLEPSAASAPSAA